MKIQRGEETTFTPAQVRQRNTDMEIRLAKNDVIDDHKNRNEFLKSLWM